MGSCVRTAPTPSRRFCRRACVSVALVAIVFVTLAPWLLTSRHRAIRHVRAWGLGAVLLDDAGVIFQSNRADCGHTCLMIALGRLRQPVPPDLFQLARRATVGLSVAELVTLARASGLSPRFHRVPTTCVRRALRLVAPPAIVLVGTHYLVLDGPLIDGVVTVIDPALGRLRAPIEILEQEWRQALVTFTAESTPDAACPQNTQHQGGLS